MIPLFEYMRNPSEIDFDDKILQFETILMKKTESISQTGWELLRILYLIQEKYKFSLTELFPILNCYLYYGKQQLLANKGYFDIILSMCEKCFFACFDALSYICYSESCLLFQQIFCSYSEVLNDKISSLIVVVLQRIGSDYPNFYVAKLFGVLFSCILYNPQSAFFAISSCYQNNIENFFSFV